MKFWKVEDLMIQLELFEKTKEELIEKKLEKLHQQHEKVRKSQFARISSLNKIVEDLVMRMKIYDEFLCKGNVSSKSLQMDLPFIDS